MASNRLRSIAEHREIVLRDLHRTPVVLAALDDCLGLALARSERAEFPLPPFANSAMDGYAVRSADVVNVPVLMPVAADIPAGSDAITPLIPGTAHRVMTGAPIPDGADAVVRVEWTDGGTSEVRVERSVSVGAEIRLPGEDLAVGDVIGTPGSAVSAANIGAFASLGMSQLAVHRRPRVAVVATGDELVSVGGALSRGTIFDSNSHLMAALVRGSGGEVVAATRIGDNVEAAIERLTELAANCDLLVTMGGVSAGAYEVIKDVFATLGGVEFCGVAVQPGKPQGFGYLNGTPVVALPGNPVSSLVSFELFVRPALRTIGGFTNVDRPRVSAHLAASVAPSDTRVRYLAATLNPLAGIVTPPTRSGSHLIAHAAAANCLIEVPIGNADLPVGAGVSVLWLGG